MSVLQEFAERLLKSDSYKDLWVPTMAGMHKIASLTHLKNRSKLRVIKNEIIMIVVSTMFLLLT